MDSPDLPNTPLQEGPTSPYELDNAPPPQQQPALVDQAIQREVDEVIYSDVCFATA